MFPNPQDALPLPPHPNLERYKKLAKELIKACKSGEPESIGAWAEEWVEALVKHSGLTTESPVRIQRWIDEVEEFARRKLLGSQADGRRCALADAQFVIARSHGFPGWPKFLRHARAIERDNSPEARFEAAADAIVTGDMAKLQQLLRDDPKLIHARSSREHHATLLHYTSANGVEGYRQKTPANIVEIAGFLLQAGAEIDATADVYGGGCTTLGLAATSIYPELAGVQEALLQKLLDYGANMDQQSNAGHGQFLVFSCLANGRPKAAEFLAKCGARLDLAAAAALGWLDVVKSFFNEDDGLKSNATQEQVKSGFLYACEYGRNNVVEFLLQKGMEIAISGGDGQTPLHWAVIGGHLEMVKLLLQYKPPLEARNVYGGTVLGQTLWSAAHGGDPDVYIAIIETLMAAGAKLPPRHVPVNQRIDEVLRRYGSEPEESWYWQGEKPRRKKSKS